MNLRLRSSSAPVSKLPLRLGRIAYTNVAPIETAFDRGAVVRDGVVTSAAPNVLNAQLSSGRLDISPVSAAHFLRNQDELMLCGDVAIVSRGEVLSVLLVSAQPPAQLGRASIAVTADSASGRALLECVLRGKYGVDATFAVSTAPAQEAMLGRPTLLIGDAAVAIREHVPLAWVYDLGTAWYAWTKLPMVFAVWAVRRDVARTRPDDVERIVSAYRDARAWGNSHRPEVIDAAVAQRPQPRAFYEMYYKTLHYRLDTEARAGLARFEVELAQLETLHAAR